MSKETTNPTKSLEQAAEEYKPFKEIVGIAIGRASVCWDELPHGIFDSTRASELVDEIVSAYDQLASELAEARAEIESLKKERTAYRTINAIAGDISEKVELHDEIEVRDQIISIYEKALKEISSFAFRPKGIIGSLDIMIVAAKSLDEAERLKK